MLKLQSRTQKLQQSAQQKYNQAKTKIIAKKFENLAKIIMLSPDINLANSSTLEFQDIIEPQIKLNKIQNNHYFLLINKKYKQSLSYRQNSRYSQQHAILSEIDENDLQQIFQIQQIQDQKYQIVHTISTLVFTNEQIQVMLGFGKWKSSQFFYPQKINNNSEKLQYWIKSSKNSGKLLYYDGFALRCSQRNLAEDDTVWEIRLCLHNKRLNKSCWLQYVFSNQVVDIPEATDKSDVNVIQYPCNYRLNQRFSIQKRQQGLYTIESIKTLQYLTVAQNSFSTTIVQEGLISGKNSNKQRWRIEYVGNGLYTIRSAIRQNMYLVVKQRSTKMNEVLTISDNQAWCLWKIVGNFNIDYIKDKKV